MAENWKSIPGFGAYDVSDMGRVRSYYAGGKLAKVADISQRIIQPGTSNGYRTVILTTNGQRYGRRVAHLVLLAFAGPRPRRMQVCHYDGNPGNDKLCNLRYDTPKGNLADRSETARRASRRKLTDEQVIAIRKRFAADETLTQVTLAAEYDMAPCSISNICTGKTFAHLPGPIIDKGGA